ncbi:Hsp20/alpha crystallin family protein [Nonlabens ponticola]|uniref:Hsp20/alpha crystallin family protein n=1 Tax=Nonlabens ponticola TaxID=2496866 RepID=A0A3S9MZG1_9FLAO|nr:Hsp20/alpha crystallin family protein [Nonlabens ponticola]AZQ44539.1 Hsp20/alpha crystallin family protein [Nonlabens ponticola]
MKLAHRTANNWLPSLIDDMFNNDYAGGSAVRASQPAVNIAEGDDHFALEMVIPGFSKDEVSIEIDQDVLSIYAEVETEEKEATEQFTRQEFVKKSFKRSFNLPETVNQDKIDANYEDGILKVALPKKEEALPQPKRMISLK